MFLCAYEDVIPVKFHNHSGVKEHQFRIRTKKYLNHTKNQNGYLIEILLDGIWELVFLPYEKYPYQIEALSILSGLDGESERQGRYINVHMAYEAVIKNRDIDYSSIRHALAHPVTRLTRPHVRSSLMNRFGDMEVDLKNYQHQKEIYRCIGEMLIKIEETIYEEVAKNEENLTRHFISQ